MEQERHLIGPWADFFLLGGASLAILPFAFYSYGPETLLTLLVFSYIVADLLNHPHFAVSYILFYRTLKEKLRTRKESFNFWIRTVMSGIIIPILLIAYLGYGIVTKDYVLLGHAFNAMAFLVGWHYTKQGYGMLIVDSVLKRKFYSLWEKRIFLFNGFSFWLLTWSYGNHLISESNYWGVPYATLDIPMEVIYGLLILSGATGLATIVTLVRRVWVLGVKTAWTGVMAYLISVYMWLLMILSPLLIIFIPAFHSLQYLTVVYRFEANRAANNHKTRNSVLAVFAASVVLGFCIFWLIPGILDGEILRKGYATTVAVYAFSFWIFVNIHHYFIDNVLWRKENQEVKQNLFS